MNILIDSARINHDYAALANLNTGEFKVLAFAVDHRAVGVLYGTNERRFGVGILADGSFRFEAPREPWDVAIDLLTLLRCGTLPKRRQRWGYSPTSSRHSRPCSQADGQETRA